MLIFSANETFQLPRYLSDVDVDVDIDVDVDVDVDIDIDVDVDVDTSPCVAGCTHVSVPV